MIRINLAIKAGDLFCIITEHTPVGLDAIASFLLGYW